jgi:hypothetical protein
MRWYPKSLKCQIYENNELVDLNTCSDPCVDNLADAIFVHWRTPTNSAIWFDVQIYEKHYWFRPNKTSIEIEAYKHAPETIAGRKQVDISKLYIDRMVGKKFKIKPENTMFRKWSENVEVAFVA